MTAIENDKAEKLIAKMYSLVYFPSELYSMFRLRWLKFCVESYETAINTLEMMIAAKEKTTEYWNFMRFSIEQKYPQKEKAAL